MAGAVQEGLPRPSTDHRAWRRLSQDRLAVFCVAVVLAYGLVALACGAGWLAGDWQSVSDNSLAGPSPAHPFGTNLLGQDILARALQGTRTAFEIGVTVAVLSTLVGAILGGLAGYGAGSILDEAVLWLQGVIDSVPFYLLVAAVAYAVNESEIDGLRGNPWAIQAAMIAAFWTTTGRLVRGEVMSLRERDFVEAARATGASPAGILLRHLLPNAAPILIVQTTLVFVAAIKTEVVLSFLGLGMERGVSWGQMIAQAVDDVQRGHLGNFLAASLLLFFLVLCVNLLADSLQDALDPRARGRGASPAALP